MESNDRDQIIELRAALKIVNGKILELEKKVTILEKERGKFSEIVTRIELEVKLSRKDLDYISKQLEKLESAITESNEKLHKRISGTKDQIDEIKENDMDELLQYRKAITSTVIKVVIGGILGAVITKFFGNV